jgi:hypothetical protein
VIEAIMEQYSKAEYGLVTEKANRAAKWAGTGLGFSIPVSTALDRGQSGSHVVPRDVRPFGLGCVLQ